MIEEGDKYIHFTKRGGINRGIVKSIGTVNVIDTNNKVSYTTYYMINEKNVQYQLDGIVTGKQIGRAHV